MKSLCLLLGSASHSHYRPCSLHPPSPQSLLVVLTLDISQKHQVPGQQSQLLPPLHSIWNPTPTVRRWDGNEALLGPSKYCSCFLYSHLGFMECGSGSAYKSMWIALSIPPPPPPPLSNVGRHTEGEQVSVRSRGWIQLKCLLDPITFRKWNQHQAE